MKMKKLLLVSMATMAFTSQASTGVEEQLITPFVKGADGNPVADPEQYKSYVQLHIGNQYSSSQHCGGSIYKDNLIITAAHCLFNKTKDAVFVDGSFSDLLEVAEYEPMPVDTLKVVVKNHTTDVYVSELKSVKQYYVHPKFQFKYTTIDRSDNEKMYDIAIIELETPINEKDNVASINFPTTDVVTEYDKGLELFDLVGLGDYLNDEDIQSNNERIDEMNAHDDAVAQCVGNIIGDKPEEALACEDTGIEVRDYISPSKPTELRHVKLKLEDDSNCDLTLATNDDVDVEESDFIICTQPIDSISGDYGSSGSGDSGGPMFFTHTDGTQYQVGVVNSSFGYFDSYFTELFSYKDWIEDAVSNQTDMIMGNDLTYDPLLNDGELHSVGDNDRVIPDSENPDLIGGGNDDGNNGNDGSNGGDNGSNGGGSSGGSFGFLSLLGLFGFSLVRRKKQ